jgi:hypothetical protein
MISREIEVSMKFFIELEYVANEKLMKILWI